MVHCRSFVATPEPSDPLSYVRSMRTAQDEALARGLGFSAFAHLTVVVAALLVAVAFRAPEVRSFDPPIILETEGDRGGTEYAEPSGAPPPAPIEDFAPNRVVIPARDEETPEDPPLVVPDSRPIETGRAFDGATDGGGAGGPPGAPGEGLPGAVAIPPPDSHIVVEELPALVHHVKPSYPEMPRAAGLEGKVIVRMFVGVDGRVLRAEIERSSPLFDDAALGAARQWVFTPAKMNDHAVGVWVRVPIQFRLR